MRTSVLTGSLSALLFAGCATGPRVTDVLRAKRLEQVIVMDRGYFVNDRASGLPLNVETLPADQRGEYFEVSWTPATIASVKFEYRQLNRPNKVSAQTLTPATGRRSTMFRVVGNEFQDGGMVSAWRVSLIQGDQVVAAKQSALW